MKYEYSPQLAYVTESGKPLTGPAASIIATSKQPNVDNDACKPLTMNMTGKYALISRGGCLFDEKVLLYPLNCNLTII
jgi:hypothetical protein